MDMESLGRRVRVYRATHAITQMDLAARLGISQSALSLLENNKFAKQLTAEKLAQIHKACKPGKVVA